MCTCVPIDSYGYPIDSKFQPIELLWRGTKNFVAREWFLGRAPKQTANDVMGFWCGCEASNKRGKKQAAHGPKQAVGHLAEVRGAINEWIARRGSRLPGELEGLSYDAELAHTADGPLGDDDDCFDEGIESDGGASGYSDLGE